MAFNIIFLSTYLDVNILIYEKPGMLRRTRLVINQYEKDKGETDKKQRGTQTKEGGEKNCTPRRFVDEKS